MAFLFVEPRIGAQPIADTSTTKNHALGTIAKAKDATLGEGEFIYLLGVASTAIGLAVTYSKSSFQTALLANTANLGEPVAWAMSANVASQYGWYQIGGVVTALKTNVSVEVGKAMFISATSGRVMDTVASGKQILGAKSANLATVTTTTSTLLVYVNRPHAQGQAI